MHSLVLVFDLPCAVIIFSNFIIISLFFAFSVSLYYITLMADRLIVDYKDRLKNIKLLINVFITCICD